MAFWAVWKALSFSNGFGRDQRGVAGEHDDLVVGRESFAGNHEGVSGAALLGLQDEVDAGMGNRFAHAISLMSDDGEDVSGGHDLGRCGDDVGENWLAADFVENLGVPGFESRSFAGGHDCDGHAGRMGRLRSLRCFRHI